MIKSIYLLPILLIFTILSCTSNDNDMEEQEQDYTSFVVTHEIDSHITKNAVVGYKQEDGTWKRLASYNIEGTKQSQETIVDYNKVKIVRLFRDLDSEYPSDRFANVVFDFVLEKDKKNIIIIHKITNASEYAKKDDPKQYPI